MDDSDDGKQVELSGEMLAHYGGVVDGLLGSSDEEGGDYDGAEEMFHMTTRPDRLGLGADFRANPKLVKSLGDEKSQDKLKARILGHKSATFRSHHHTKEEAEKSDSESSEEEESLLSTLSQHSETISKQRKEKDIVMEVAQEKVDRKRKQTRARNLRKKKQKQKKRENE